MKQFLHPVNWRYKCRLTESIWCIEGIESKNISWQLWLFLWMLQSVHLWPLDQWPGEYNDITNGFDQWESKMINYLCSQASYFSANVCHCWPFAIRKDTKVLSEIIRHKGKSGWNKYEPLRARGVGLPGL